jgi:hypothetical protein
MTQTKLYFLNEVIQGLLCMGVLVDGYRLSVFGIKVTRIRCELKADEMGGNVCIMWSFMMCSAC